MTQALTLRTVTRQAGGGEIVRTRALANAEGLIGRAPDCDIHLPDLAVDMQHALLRVTGENRVTIDSLTGQPFQMGGKPLLRVELDVTKKPVVAFGDYDLVLAAGAEGDVAVTVIRREEDAALGPSLFSLRASVFGRRRMAWTFGLMILALCLILPFAAGGLFQGAKIRPDQQWSTGPLSKAHAFLEKDCKTCHVSAFVAVRDSACLSCHQAGRTAQALAASDARVEAKGSANLPLLVFDHAPRDRLRRSIPAAGTPTGMVAGAFQAAFDHPTDRCASCHREHTTAAPDPTVARKSDILRPGKPSLIVVRDCAACHDRLKMRLPSTQLIDTPDWNRHPDFRPLLTQGFDGPSPKIVRVALDSHPVEANGLTFSHRIHMNPLGGVARQAVELGVARGYGGVLKCESCHRPDGGGGFKPMEQERDCGTCHSLAFAQVGGQFRTLKHHDLRNVAGVLRGSTPLPGAPAVDPGVLRRGMAPGGLCVDCHTIRRNSGPLGAEIAPVKVAERMLPRGDFNHGIAAHSGQGQGAAQCADCHKAATSDKASDVLLEGIATCRACHGKTEHDTPRFAAANCGECHSYHAPGQAPRTGQDRLFTALGLPAGQKPRGMPTF